MSTLKDELLEDMKIAMKQKDKERLSVIRMARAAIKNVEIDKRKDLTDEEVIEILAKEVKSRRDAITEYEKAGRDDVVQKLQQEIEILSKYLPRQLTREELEVLVNEVVAQVNATSLKDMGKVMGAIMPKVKGRADGKLVNQLVREKLSKD
ncbi:glutamyl-tRNA amidotransferase [Anoxybacter fermentans]|uniref:Glutamyl-tRNA amidotransferase n=1 Tax=Anoxybacter fermentans TaxID=1323375 RepID=A0A3S9SXU7_9FIRM|nr:GatB/YqeY domain-containing protein [Anoxybacter fermentans]AZR73166.1 glutamyl-tRNA amidotransferase [Anoxybacter fermentans]